MIYSPGPEAEGRVEDGGGGALPGAGLPADATVRPTDGVGLASESASHASLYQEQPAREVDAPTRFPSPSRHDPAHASNAVRVDIGLIANPSRVSDSERFQVLTNHFKPEKGTKLAYQQVKKSDNVLCAIHVGPQC